MRSRHRAIGWLAAAGLAGMSTNLPAQPEPGEEEPASELERARERLEAAARDLAELSADVAGPVVDDVMRRLRLGDRARATLGVVVENASEGARVTSVSPGGPAAEAGVRAGDVIVAIDGAGLADDPQQPPTARLIGAMEDVAPGETVAVMVRRGPEQRELSVEAGRLERFGRRIPDPAPFVFWRGPAGERASPRLFLRFRPWQAMELVELTPELGEYFGTEEGMLVVRAPEDDALGLRDGDVILAIGDRVPTTPEHAMRILASFVAGEMLRMTIVRQGERQTLELEVPASAERR